VRRQFSSYHRAGSNYLNAYLGLGVVLLRQSGSLGASSVRPRTHNASAYELMGAMLIQQGRSSEAIAALKSQQHWLSKQ